MILLFLCTVVTIQAHPTSREWRAVDRSIHNTCRQVNTPSELIISYESQSVVVEHAYLLALASIMGLNHIRLQTMRDQLTAPDHMKVELRLLSQSLLVSSLTIQKQADALDLFTLNLKWLQQMTEQSISQMNERKPRWHKLCQTQAKHTSEVAKHTYEVLMKELTKLRLMTIRVNATFVLTLVPIT